MSDIINIAIELAKLHILQGAEFVRQLKIITNYRLFRPIENEPSIYSTGGEGSKDFEALLNAARKAVAHGNKVYILPNPKGIRTADFIFENKGVYKMYDLKTIHGKASVIDRLLESVGQANHVLINIATEYNARTLAKQIVTYFYVNPDALEVLVFKGTKSIQVKRKAALDKEFVKKFIFTYNK